MVWHAQECAQGGPLTSFVSERWASPQPNGLVLSEAEARYLFRVRIGSCAPEVIHASGAPCIGAACCPCCSHMLCIIVVGREVM